MTKKENAGDAAALRLNFPICASFRSFWEVEPVSTTCASVLSLGGEAGAASFAAEVNALAGVRVESCYQCGKCSGGCPLSFAMDYQPRQVMRLVQLGLVKEALSSSTIWICATCYTCTARCPRDIDIAGVMDALRVMARRQGIRPGDHNIGVFHRLFIDSVRRFGRSYELGLMLLYKLGTLRLTEDIGLGLKMLARGKLSLLPEATSARREIEAIFREAEAGSVDRGSSRAAAAGARAPRAAAAPAGAEPREGGDDR